MIRVANADKYASNHFANAVDEYKNSFNINDEIVTKLNNIKFYTTPKKSNNNY